MKVLQQACRGCRLLVFVVLGNQCKYFIANILMRV